MQRKRYQNGSLTQEKRKDGTVVWVYRWRTEDSNGNITRPKKTIGTRQQYPTRSAALRAIEGLRMDLNRQVDQVGSGLVSIREVYAHYKLLELGESSTERWRTIEVIENVFSKYVGPKWGDCRLRDIKATEVERWLKELQLAPSTKQRLKGVMVTLYEHAMRHEWTTHNPILSVRQSGEGTKEFIVFSANEIRALLGELDDPAYTITLLAAATGMRRGELFGLKWKDVDFDRGEINVVRSMVHQIEGDPKTRASRRPLPISAEIASALHLWRSKCLYPAATDWVFASQFSRGKLPLWPDAVLKRHLRPAAARAQLSLNFGWHTFRRTLATLLQSSGASVKTTQDLLRHASPVLTMSVYAQAVDGDKRSAHETVASLFSGTKPQR